MLAIPRYSLWHSASRGFSVTGDLLVKSSYHSSYYYSYMSWSHWSDALHVSGVHDDHVVLVGTVDERALDIGEVKRWVLAIIAQLNERLRLCRRQNNYTIHFSASHFSIVTSINNKALSAAPRLPRCLVLGQTKTSENPPNTSVQLTGHGFTSPVETNSLPLT